MHLNEYKTNSIVLVGSMGSGKTSTGRRLADALERDFFDSDIEVIKHTGVSIDHIFDVEGEVGFRQREIKMLSKLCILKNSVIATGGGSVISAENREVIKRNNFVVYLHSSIEQLLNNTSKSKSRPMLEQSNNREKTIRELFKQRKPLYQQVADAVINTAEKSTNTIINEIIKTYSI